MKTKICFALAVLAPAAALAGSPFDGTWKSQADSFQFSGKPMTYELKDGTYKCTWCAPPYSVKADGAEHKVVGNGYYDTALVRVIDAHSVQVEQKLSGKLTLKVAMTVSADGKTMTSSVTDLTGSQAASYTTVAKRTAAGPAGSHALAGAWQVDKVPDLSDTVSTISYKMTADGFQMQWNGQSYDAKFDGKKYLTENDPGKTWVSLKKISNDTVEETDSRDGKVTDVVRMTVSADGKTMSVVDEDLAHGTTMKYKMSKQP
jgi:hypothetical protein